MQVLLVIRHLYASERLFVARHGHVVEGEGVHARLRHIFLGEDDGELPETVGTEVEADYRIPLLYSPYGPPLGIHPYYRFYELVGYTLIVGFLHRSQNVSSGCASPGEQHVVGQFYPLPPLVSIHSVIASYYACYLRLPPRYVVL